MDIAPATATATQTNFAGNGIVSFPQDSARPTF
jgi:hypothetical protein